MDKVRWRRIVAGRSYWCDRGHIWNEVPRKSGKDIFLKFNLFTSTNGKKANSDEDIHTDKLSN